MPTATSTSRSPAATTSRSQTCSSRRGRRGGRLHRRAGRDGASAGARHRDRADRAPARGSAAFPWHGIELSRAMVARLRAKPGGADMPVAIGDFATTTARGLVLGRLPRLQHDHEPDDAGGSGRVLSQRRGASRAGRLLRRRGPCVPELRLLPPGETFRPFHVSESKWGIDEYDVANQGLISHHLRDRRRKVERFSIPFRYVWPAELDLMAQIAGMRLRERWGDWSREPFTSESGTHVSVWEKAASAIRHCPLGTSADSCDSGLVGQAQSRGLPRPAARRARDADS